MKIVVDSDIPYVKGVLEPYAEIAYVKGRNISPEDIAGAEVLVVRTRTRCNEALLRGSGVRMIATATIGFDHIDMDYCRRAGIKVVTAAGSNARGVLQWMGAALAYASDRQGWQPHRKTLGVVGVGHVGSLVYDYARQWGFTVLGCDPVRKQAESDGVATGFVNLGEIAARCDIVSFHTPLSRDGDNPTFHMAETVFLGKLRPGTLIINTSRGEVIDTQALLSAVDDGLCTCCIDTWENEPDIDRRLLASAMLATPHIAGYSAQGKANATSMMVQAISREYDLPLTDWYPSEVHRVQPSAISWDELRRTIGSHFDIAALSDSLKRSPGGFEDMRNNYDYRQEYF